MLDFTPPPAVYEEAPEWARTPSGLIIPTKKSVLPGMTPYPGLVGGAASAGNAQIPPWPAAPTINAGTINAAATSGTPVASGAVAASAYSQILFWAGVRTSPGGDTTPQSHVITDNQGGTYSKIGIEQKFTNGASNTALCQLWMRDQLIPAGGLSVTLSMTITTVATSPWATGYVFEVKNPGNFPFKYAVRNQQALNATTNFVMPDSGDLFVMDFASGGGATSALSAGSGMTQIASASTFVSSNLRHTVWASALQTQKAGRTYGTTGGGVVISVAMWFDGPKRSKPALALQYCGKYQAVNNPSSFSITGANIGTPAADRMVHLLLMQVYTVTLSPSMSSSTPAPTLLPWAVQTTTSGQRAPNVIYSALVPTGTTMDFTFSSNQIGYWVVYIWASYGQARIGANLVGSILGDPQVPRNVQVANGGALTATSVVVPAGAILFGGAHAYTGAVGVAGAWTADDTNPVSGGGAGFGARLDNSASATDLLAQTLSMTMGGSNNAGLVGMSIGP